MLDLTNKTMSSILSSMLLRITENVNKREGSLIRTALSAAAWVFEGIYIELINIQKQAYAETAYGEYLDMKAAERGLYRIEATNEICELFCNLSNIELDTQFADSSGYTWNVSSAVISGPDSENLYKYHITCQTQGAIATPNGDLRSLGFIAGLSTAKFGAVVSSGQDIETDDRLRSRYLEDLASAYFTGNVAAYRSKMLAMSYPLDDSSFNIGALQVYPFTNESGVEEGGHVRIWCVNYDMKALNEDELASVQNAVCPVYNGIVTGLGYGFAPIGAAVHISSATSMPKLSVDIKLQLKGVTVNEVREQITNNIKNYVKSRIEDWGEQVKSPYESAEISIREAFISAACIVSGVKDVEYVRMYKAGTYYDGTASWVTNRTSMEWIDIDNIEINITT